MAGKRKLDALTGRLGNEFEIPQSAFCGMVHIELNGNTEAIVDGCRGVVEYDESIIRLNTGKLIVRFSGTCLSIRTLSMNQAVVCGCIESIDFTT